MAKARKAAGKKASGKARSASKSRKAPKGTARKFTSSAVGVKRKEKRNTPVRKNRSVGGRVVDAIKEAALLRSKLSGHETFED